MYLCLCENRSQLAHKLILHIKVIRLQRSGIDTIKYHTWPRIPMGKWQTHRRHHKREPRGQPFPSRWPQITYKQTRTKHSKHKTEQKHKRSTKEVPPWNAFEPAQPSLQNLSKSYTMGCPPVRGDNPRALASGLSPVQVHSHGLTILYRLHLCRPCTSRDISW